MEKGGLLKMSMKSGINRDTLKLIAVISMLVDHIGAILFPQVMILRVIGRFAFPIFAFMIAEGCIYTKNKFKYLKNILLFGIIAQMVKIYFNDNLKLNIMFTFTLSVIMIYILQYGIDSFTENKSQSRKIYASLLFVLSVAVVYIINITTDIDYGFAGCAAPLIVFAGSYIKNDSINANRVKTVFLALALSLVYMRTGGVQIYSFAALAPLWFYNGQKGTVLPKYFFYVFYPAHLAVLYAIKMFI